MRDAQEPVWNADLNSLEMRCFFLVEEGEEEGEEEGCRLNEALDLVWSLVRPRWEVLPWIATSA